MAGRGPEASRRGVEAVVGGLLDALVRAPVTRAQTLVWLPAGWLWRWLIGAGWLVLSAGLIGGTISELLVTLRVPPIIGPFLGLALAAPTLFAPWWPLLAWRVMVVGVLIEPLVVALGGRHDAVWPWPVTACVAMLLVLILVGASYPRPTVVGVGLLTVAAVFAFGARAGMPFWIGYILTGAIVAGLVFGDAVGGRRSIQARLEEQQALRRQDLARQAVLEERGRIARELHDVVAHHMTMIAIQAEAAPLKVPGIPPAAAEIFATINRAAREALSETRTVVGLLRSDEETAERSPAPGLVLLDDLVTSARNAGLNVTPTVVGVPRPLAAAVDVSAYRILQEALSNASRYAPGSQVRLEVRYSSGALFLAVENTATADTDAAGRAAAGEDRAASSRAGSMASAGGRRAAVRTAGSAAPAEAAGMAEPAGIAHSERAQSEGARSEWVAQPQVAELGGGHGLVGMRERVTMLGGTLDVGPRPDGGFAVRVEIPTPA